MCVFGESSDFPTCFGQLQDSRRFVKLLTLRRGPGKWGHCVFCETDAWPPSALGVD